MNPSILRTLACCALLGLAGVGTVQAQPATAAACFWLNPANWTSATIKACCWMPSHRRDPTVRVGTSW